MKTTIVPPTPEEPKITLELSVDEYVAFYGLLFSKGDGTSDLRARMHNDFHRVRSGQDNHGTVVVKAMKAFEDETTRIPFFHRVDRAMRNARA